MYILIIIPLFFVSCASSGFSKQSWQMLQSKGYFPLCGQMYATFNAGKPEPKQPFHFNDISWFGGI